MLATNGRRWFERSRPESRWPSFVVSVGVTFALFTAAFTSMRSVARRVDRVVPEEERPVMLHLEPPPRSRPAEPPPRVSSRIPTSAPAVVAPLAPTAPLAPAVPPPAIPPRDSSSSASPAPRSEAIPIGIAPPSSARGARDTAMAVRGGAPIAPSGFSIGARMPNTARYRDSTAHVRMLSIPGLARGTSIDAQDAATLENSHSTADALRRRVTTAGNGRDVAVPLGQGKDGVGAVGGGGTYIAAGGMNGLGVHGSIAFPLFSSGPSPEQRKRDAKIDAEYQLRLRVFEDRILLRRDSLRADSVRRVALRRDSLRLDSLARASRSAHPREQP